MRLNANPYDAGVDVWVPGGRFRMGSDRHYPEEAPVREVEVDGFWIDPTPVTNAQFARFVEATGYRTYAEIPPDPAQYPDADPALLVAGSAVFVPTRGPVPLDDPANWWTHLPGASWRTPLGPGSDWRQLPEHPVVHVTLDDARAYARWAQRDLPTEQEWEYAASFGDDLDLPRVDGRPVANYWQGEFPWRNLCEDGFPRTSPVTAFPPNRLGLYDLIGNVWEWTESRWSTVAAKPGCCRAPSGDAERHVIRGGSHLCAENYCRRYRRTARHAQALDTPTGHVGFRCIRRAAAPDGPPPPSGPSGGAS